MTTPYYIGFMNVIIAVVAVKRLAQEVLPFKEMSRQDPHHH